MYDQYGFVESYVPRQSLRRTRSSQHIYARQMLENILIIIGAADW